jgi:hypothetical protein
VVGSYCDSCSQHTVYQNANGCFGGNQYSIPSLGQTYSYNPSNGGCNYNPNWVNNGGQTCNGYTLQQQQVDNNPCSNTYGQTQTVIIENNSASCGYSPCFCYTISNNDTAITYTYGRCGTAQDITASLNPGESINVCSRYYPSVSSGGNVSGGSSGCSNNAGC